MSYEKSLLLNAAVYSQLRIGLFSFENGMYLVILVLKSPVFEKGAEGKYLNH